VIQDGGLGEDCNYFISPTARSFASAGGSGVVSVSAESRCAWQAVSNASWIVITSAEAGIGGGAVSYSVAANPGASGRSGTISVAGATLRIKQKGS
jgi:hypothetical protein